MKFKLKNFIKNIRGSEVVEKMMMVIASVTLVAVGIGFMNKFINSAIENQIGDNSHQIEMPNGNGGSAGGQGGTVTPPIISPDESIEQKLLGNWHFNKTPNFDSFPTEGYSFKGYSENYSRLKGFAGFYLKKIMFFPETNEFEITFLEKHLNGSEKTNVIKDGVYKYAGWERAFNKFGLINIVDVSEISDKKAFYNWLVQNAEKQTLKTLNMQRLENLTYNKIVASDVGNVYLNNHYYSTQELSNNEWALVEYDANIENKKILKTYNCNDIPRLILIQGDNSIWGIYNNNLYEINIQTKDIVEVCKDATFDINCQVIENKIYSFGRSNEVKITDLETKTSEIKKINVDPNVKAWTPYHTAGYCNGKIYFDCNEYNDLIAYDIEHNKGELIIDGDITADVNMYYYSTFVLNNKIYFFRVDGFIKCYDTIEKKVYLNYEPLIKKDVIMNNPKKTLIAGKFGDKIIATIVDDGSYTDFIFEITE